MISLQLAHTSLDSHNSSKENSNENYNSNNKNNMNNNNNINNNTEDGDVKFHTIEYVQVPQLVVPEGCSTRHTLLHTGHIVHHHACKQAHMPQTLLNNTTHHYSNTHSHRHNNELRYLSSLAHAPHLPHTHTTHGYSLGFFALANDNRS